MTIKRLMDMVQELTRTPVSDTVLLNWLSNCENTILTDIFLAAPESCTEYTAITENDLLVPHPFDKLYLPYMQAQIYHAAGEFMQYDAYMQLYNEYRDEYARYVLSTMNPATGEAVSSGYYLTAYAIAVAHGYSGSEEEWIRSLKGSNGKSAYDLAVEGGYEGTLEQFESETANLASAVKYTEQSLTDEQKARARENIGAATAGDTGGIPIARCIRLQSTDDIFTATGDDLPEVHAGDGNEQIPPEGKGKQIIFIPYDDNETQHPKLKINDGETIEIRMRASKNKGSDDDRPDATDLMPVGALMCGVPYTMTFCGKYWLIDSMIDSTGGKENKPTVLTWDEQQYPELIDFLRSITEVGKYEFRRNIDDAYQYQYELTVSDNGEEREYYGFLRYFVCDEPVLGYSVYIGKPGTERFYEHPTLSLTTRQDLENAIGDIESALNTIRGVTA